MNDEKQIAQAILDAQKMREESWQVHKPADAFSNGEYTLEFDDCFIAAAKKNNLEPSMWYLLSLANHWYNDIQAWAEAILADKDVYSLFRKPEEIDDTKQS